MKDDLGGIKEFLRMEFSVGGNGYSYNGVLYPAGETGLKNFARAVAADGAFDHVIVTQQGFEGGYATGTEGMPKRELLAIIMELLKEFGFITTTSVRQLMVFADYSQGLATT